jgi:hypothetical protein
MLLRKCTLGMIAVLMSGSILWAGAAQGQSLDEKNPSTLHAGDNLGFVKTVGVPQYWSFNAEPGPFRVIFYHTGPDGSAVDARLSADGTKIAMDVRNGATTWTGTAPKRSRVTLEVRLIQGLSGSSYRIILQLPIKNEGAKHGNRKRN